jgi:DNA polymerase
MFVGEAPGRNEDIQGRPFVGRAGILLNELIHSIGLERKDIYITNIIKCRPPKNRNPLKKEITICKLYLDKQIDIIRPKVIAPLGNFSSSYILEKFNCKCKNIGMIHGKTFDIKIQSFDISIIPLYHPAAAIYNPNLKDLLIRDFKSITAALTKK